MNTGQTPAAVWQEAVKTFLRGTGSLGWRWNMEKKMKDVETNPCQHLFVELNELWAKYVLSLNNETKKRV